MEPASSRRPKSTGPAIGARWFAAWRNPNERRCAGSRSGSMAGNLSPNFIKHAAPKPDTHP
jgi:hypothetical protein